MNNEVTERKEYYVFYDKIARVYGEPFAAKNSAEALRAFHLSIAQQKQKGMISDVDDYKLFCVARFTTYADGTLDVFCGVEEIVDNEVNNKE